MAHQYEKQDKKVKAARIRLLGKAPFFGDLAYSMLIEWDDTLNPPTAATDGFSIWFHPAMVDTLTMEETMFLLAHEVMHPAYLHMCRRGNREFNRWNLACDIVINYVLVQYNVGTMPKWMVYEPALYLQGDGNVDKIYDLLDPNQVDTAGSGGTGQNQGTGKQGSFDVVRDAPQGKAADAVAKWRDKLRQAEQVATAAGNMPGELSELVEQLVTPKVPWEQELREFAVPSRGKDRSWTKRNNRYAPLGIRVPGYYGDVMGDFVFAIDCSGSTSDRMVGQSGAELISIKDEFRPEKVHILYFDSDVKHHDEYGPDDPVGEIKAYGRGGTCFRTVFEYIEKNNLNPEFVVVATDLECSDFGPEPSYPVLWCVMESDARDAPWGKVLPIDLD